MCTAELIPWITPSIRKIHSPFCRTLVELTSSRICEEPDPGSSKSDWPLLKNPTRANDWVPNERSAFCRQTSNTKEQRCERSLFTQITYEHKTRECKWQDHQSQSHTEMCWGYQRLKCTNLLEKMSQQLLFVQWKNQMQTEFCYQLSEGLSNRVFHDRKFDCRFEMERLYLQENS
jgi:hypothetical protein